MSRLSLSTLGSLRIKLDGQKVAHFRTNHVPALLVYLTVEDTLHDPRPHRRDEIMGLLWPGLPEKSARANLRQNLYLLRKAFSAIATPDVNGDPVAFLQGDYQTIQINPAVAYELDVAHFTQLLHSTRIHSHLSLTKCVDCQQKLRQATRLYQGSFLADFYMPDSDGFEAWAAQVRERLRCQVLDALEVLSDIYLAQRDFGRAEAAIRQQLDIDWLRESAYRQLMMLLARNGRRGEAVAEYESCRKLLVEQLGMAPSSKTTALYERIVAGDIDDDVTQEPRIRGYAVGEQIGNGNYGTVYRAFQTSVGRDVAIKVIQPQFANQPDFIRRFETEAQFVARLEHPHIVPLYDYWREPDGAYLVMRWLRDGSLQTKLTEGPLDLATVATIVDQIASALMVAHRQGIIHRDIKPANILLDEAGNAYLTDFGIAIDVERQLSQRQLQFAPSSPMNISPEQILDEPVTALTDLYSFGLVIFEMLTGQHPFADCPVDEILTHHLRDPIPLVQSLRSDIDPAVDVVIQRATAKQPSTRFPDALTLAEAFRLAVFGKVKGKGKKWVSAETTSIDLINPYKGLHAFSETDATNFYGRADFVAQFVARFADTAFLAIVGPSGSGKSSVAKAGLIPALRQGAIPGSENWFIAEMTPGDNPLHALQIALLQIAVDPPPQLLEPLQKDEQGLTRVLKRILPVSRDGVRSPLLLLIDQFEELFTLVEDQATRQHFLDNLLTALDALHGQLRIVVTLRADFYDRPLQYSRLGELLRQHTALVLPMTSAELEQAICNPAASVGVSVEPKLVATISADIQQQPGALPLMQYALTELFERRDGTLMTVSAYEEIGGATGALSRRAETLFTDLDLNDQEATRQLFLRLVTLGEGVEDTRRRVPLTELELLNLTTDVVNGSEQSQSVAHTEIIDQFGRYRLLTFDRDPTTRTPTAEVAHESLLREWQRLRGWLDQSRADVRQQRLLASATAEWLAMERDAGFLLSGGRLDQFSGWVENSTIALTSEEQEFLAVSMAVRADQVAAELARQQRELQTAQQLADTERERAEEQTHSNRRLRQRAVLLAVALLVAAVLAVLAIVAGLQSNENAEIAQANAALAITREAEAVLEAEQRASAESVAIAEREFAQAQERKAQARGLAGAAVKNLQIDPELSVLLALEAIETTYNEDKSWEPEAVDALHQAINAVSRLEDTLIHSGGAMNHVTYSPDGTRLGASTLLADQPVMTTVWDTATGEELFTLPTSIAMFNKEGSRLITWRVERGKELIWEIWDATSGEKLDTVPLTIDDIAYSISGTINPDWRYFANRYWDGTINVWDMTTREQIMHLTEHENMATWVEISPDNQYVVSADMAGLVKVWPISAESSGAITETASLITLPHNGYVETMAYSLDSHYLATISDDYTVTLWDIPASVVTETPTKLSQFPLTGHAERISQIAFNVDGTQLAAVSQDGEVKVWDALSGTELLTVFSNKHTRHIAFSPSGSHLVTANDGGLVQIWDITPAGEEEVLTLNAHHGIANHVAYSPDGTQLATAGNDERVRVWNADTGELLITLAGHSDNVWAVAFGPDGMQLASASNDGTIKLWDTDSWRELSELAAFSEFPLNPIPENNDLDLAFSRDGTRLFVTGMSSNPQIWDLTTGEKVTSLYGHDYNVPALALSLDGSQLATVGVEGQVIVWDSQTGRQILKEATSIYGSLDVAFSPDGQKLATADDDGTVRVWGLDEPYGERLLFTLSGHGAAVRNVAFSPDGRFIASGSANLIRIWDAETGESLYSLPGHSRVVTDIEFSPDNMHLASTGADGTVRIYVLPVNDLMLLAKSHVTRTLTNAECILYLQADTCPE